MSETIIVGVTCDVKQDELVAHCRERAAIHAQKEVNYKARLTELLEKQRKMSGYSNNPFENDVSDAQQKLRHHTERQKTFNFWAEHLPEGVTFRLSMTDLATLELTSR